MTGLEMMERVKANYENNMQSTARLYHMDETQRNSAMELDKLISSGFIDCQRIINLKQFLSEEKLISLAAELEIAFHKIMDDYQLLNESRARNRMFK
jgi:hypothetical protein